MGRPGTDPAPTTGARRRAPGGAPEPPPPTARPERPADDPGEHARRASGGGRMINERTGVEHIGRPECVEAEELEVRGLRGEPGGIDEGRGVHAEFAGSVVPAPADPPAAG